MLLSPEPTGNRKIHLALIFRKQFASVPFLLGFHYTEAEMMPEDIARIVIDVYSLVSVAEPPKG